MKSRFCFAALWILFLMGNLALAQEQTLGWLVAGETIESKIAAAQSQYYVTGIESREFLRGSMDLENVDLLATPSQAPQQKDQTLRCSDTDNANSALQRICLAINTAIRNKELSGDQAREVLLVYGQVRQQSRTLYGPGGVTQGIAGAKGAANARAAAQPAGGKFNVAGATFSNLGGIFGAIIANERVIRFYEQTLTGTATEDINARVVDALILNVLGTAYTASGQKETAFQRFDQAVKIAWSIADRRLELLTRNNMGLSYTAFSEYDKAITAYDAARSIAADLEDRASDASLLNNLGLVYAALANYNQARICYQAALDIERDLKDLEGQATTLSNLGVVYGARGEQDKAIEYYQEALKIKSSLKTAGPQLQVGDVSSSIDNKIADDSLLFNNLGAAYRELGRYDDAIKSYGQALKMQRQSNQRLAEGVALNGLGVVYFDMAQSANSQAPREKITGYYLEAIRYYEQALVIRRALKNRLGEGITLHNLMLAFKALQNPPMAIVYGKQSVNVYQEIRSEIQSLDKSLTKTFVASKKETYRILAELLISQGHLPAAEQVLAMLKEEEYFEFTRRDAGEMAKLSGRADLNPAEQKAFDEYKRITDDLATVESRQRELNTRLKSLPEGSHLSDSEQAELDRLTADLDAENKAFALFLERIKKEFSRQEHDVVSEIKENRGLQSDLKKWGEGTVALYTVVGAERYRIILTTPSRQVDGKTEISAAELNKKVELFRQVIQNPDMDPRPLGQELYNILIKPIEKDLIGANAKTLIWSLDGTLRYLPLAALYDGKQYMAEKYQQAIITLASRTRLSDEVTHNWRALGLGVSEAKPGFKPLCAVPAELSSIIRNEGSSDAMLGSGRERGVLPGKSLLNSNFTARALSDALGHNYSVVHIASHFSFRPGEDGDKSFLLLGEGTLTLDDLRTKSVYDFSGVQLLTLSACETGVGTTGADGKEIEGFGVVAQNRGAKAVLATLWSVADDSTRELMTNFYRIYSSTPNITKAEALRLAQLSLLRGAKGQGKIKNICPESQPEKKARRSETVDDNPAAGLASQPRFDTKTEKPYAHPFFWAPFILIGNWR